MTATPRAHTARSTRETRGGQVAAIAKAMGKPLLPWQRDAVDVILEIDPDTGLYWYDTFVVRVQRQAGKTHLIGNLATHRCLTLRNARCWFTAQRGKDASEWIREEYFVQLEQAAALFGTPKTAGCRYDLSRRSGQEYVRWKATRSRFQAFPPTREAMHSKQSDLTVVDEAWAHGAVKGAELRQAIRPTMATRAGAQLGIVSAAGHSGSEYLAEYVELGQLALLDPTSRLAFIDYGIGPHDDPEDLDVIAGAHPAIGYTQTMESLIAARRDFGSDVAGWARAYGTRDTGTHVAAFPPGAWNECRNPAADVRPETFGLALDVTPAGDHAALAVAWRDPRDSTKVRGELIFDGAPGDDLVGLARGLSERHGIPVAYDPISVGALDVIDRLGRDQSRATTTALTTAQVASACLGITRHVLARTLLHSSQPGLDSAVDLGVKREVGDGGFLWGRKKSTGSIAALVALTIAVRQADNLPEPRRKPVARA